MLFHGRGTDEHDLAPLLDVLDPERRLLGLTPRAPFRFTDAGAHWYAVRRIGYPDPETFHASLERAGGWLDAIPAGFGVPAARTIVGGFSQGAVMSYALGLGAGRPAPAGILALSGFMPTVPGFELDLSGREGLRVAIAHGSYDPIIGVEWGREARERLEEAGATVTYRETPVPHTVDQDVLGDLAGWVAETIKAANPPASA